MQRGRARERIDGEDRMEKRQKIKECVRTGCGYPPLVSPSKPEVQAQERVCRSFFCVLTKPAAPYLFTWLSISTLRASLLSHSLAEFMCLS